MISVMEIKMRNRTVVATLIFNGDDDIKFLLYELLILYSILFKIYR